MADSIEVVLIDGVGIPRLVPIAGDELPPYVEYAHEGRPSGPNRIVRFDHCPRMEINGLAVYRLLEYGDQPIRFERMRPVDVPFNGLSL